MATERHSDRYPTLEVPPEITDIESLRLGDPSLYQTYQVMLGAVTTSLLPIEAMLKLVEAMPATVQRDLVNRIAGMESSVLMTLKHQLHLVDSVLRRVIGEDGRVMTSDERIDISPKEAMNMSIKLTQVLTRDLPKMYKVERVQRLEEALFKVVETKLTKEQQDEVMLLLHELTMEDARRKEG